MTEFERCLRDELAALLGADPEQISVMTPFDQLGVDSLIALRFARKLHDLTGIDVDVERVLDYPTLAQLATFVDTQRNDTSTPTA